MIELHDDSEFTILIADLIKTLSAFDKGLFNLKIWVNSSELPFEFENSCDFLFLQEGIRIIDGNKVKYIWYDTITHIELVKQ